MKTSKFFKAGILACSVLALAACTSREKEAEPGHGWGEAVFSLNLVNVGETDVTVQEEATGADGAPFYGFVTSDVTSKIDDVIAKEMKSISASWKILRTGKPDPVTVSGLRRAGVPYRYIMCGLTPDGRTYGTPVEVSFETKGEYKAGTMFVSYEGRDDKKNHVFSVSGTNGGYYDIAVLTKENAAKFSSDKELLNALMEQAGEPVKGDGNILFTNLGIGEYVVYVYGVEEELVEGAYNPTLQYAKASFAIERNFDVSYASWLGNWTVPRGKGSDVWAISAKEEGKTYTITGIESIYDLEVTASYDAATGAMILAEQHNFTTISVQGSEYSVCLFSLFTYTDGKTYVWGTDNYPFLRAEFTTDENSASFSGLPMADSDGSYGNAIGFAFFATSGEQIAGGLYGDNGPDLLPNNITRGGDIPGPGPGPDPGDADYNSFLGTWKDAEGNEFTISQNEADKNYLLSGLGLDVVVDYNNGKLEFYAQDMGDVQLNDGNSLPGLFLGIDTSNYLEDAEQNTPKYLLATGTLNNGSISLKGEEFDAVYEGDNYHEVIAYMSLFVYDEKGVYGQAGKFYGISDLALACPSTLTKDGEGPEDPNPGEETVIFEEGFENGTEGWTFIDADGDSHNWNHFVNGNGSDKLTAHSGDGLIFSQSYDNDLGPLTPDNWAFTPAIKLTTNNNVSFWVTGQDQSYKNEHYGVFIMTEAPTASNLSKATKLFEKTNNANGYEQIIVSIPAEFENKTVYIGFRHFNCTDMFYLNLDDVKVTEGKPATEPDPDASYSQWLGDWTVTEKAGGSYTITVSQEEAGSTYGITGFNGFGNYNFLKATAELDPETEELVIYGGNQGNYFLCSNVNLGVDQNFNVGLMALIDYNGTEYYVSGDYELARLKLNAKGTATESCKAATLQVTLQEGADPVTFDIVGQGLYCFGMTDPTKVYTLKNEIITYYPFALAQVESSASSVCSVMSSGMLSANEQVLSNKAYSVARSINRARSARRGLTGGFVPASANQTNEIQCAGKPVKKEGKTFRGGKKGQHTGKVQPTNIQKAKRTLQKEQRQQSVTTSGTKVGKSN